MNLGVLTAFFKPIESNFSKAFSKNTICRCSCCLYGQENRRIHTITLLCSNTHYLPKGWEQILTRVTGRLFLLTRIKVLPNKERIPYWVCISSAMHRPMPCAPPVTTAILSLNSMMVSVYYYCFGMTTFIRSTFIFSQTPSRTYGPPDRYASSSVRW